MKRRNEPSSLVKFAKFPILRWDRHASKVRVVSDCLEINIDKKEIDSVVVFLLQECNLPVCCIKLSVATAFNCNLVLKELMPYYTIHIVGTCLHASNFESRTLTSNIESGLVTPCKIIHRPQI